TTSLTSLVADPSGDTMYGSTTTHGVLKVWRFTTGIDDGEGLHPAEFALHQNYPNPFNPATKIVFDLPQRSHAFLAVYDLLGRQVRVLVDGVRERGTHETSFNTTTLGSGVYFYRLRVGGFVQTKKMILQK
ncbi:MAG: 5'-Nucleotidase domain protein, partial [Bacteroidetes bacterium]|nr:5'-Nucleotidase domain protein [Bacteroidota bacterium]